MFGGIYKNKRVLVTGNTGFKGSWLCSWLLQLEAKVFGLAKDIPTQPAMFNTNRLDSRITHFSADIRDLAALKEVFREVQPEFVFHLAAQPIVKVAYDDPVDTMSSNIMGTVHLLEALRSHHQSCTAIMITSDKCYDNVEWVWGYREQDALGGKDPYSASKGAAELMIKTYFHSYFKRPDSPVRISAVRAGNVIGGGDWAVNRLVPDCIRAWSKEETVEIRSPQATRPWQHVLEPISGYLRTGQLLTENPTLNGEAYNFGPPARQNQTVLELLEALGDHWAFPGNIPLYNVHENPNFQEAGLLKLNCDKALFELAWEPTLNFVETTRFTANWYSQYYHSNKSDMARFTNKQLQQYVSIASSQGQKWTQ